MKSRILTCICAFTLLAALAIPVRLAAGTVGPQKDGNKHHRYRLVDVGTFGGPTSFLNDGFPPISQDLNNRGTVVGIADTSTPDPYAPNCFTDCFVSHAFDWHEGVLTDLGALPGGNNSSFAITINERGLIVGASENGAIDPMTGLPEVNAVLWEKGHIINLGTLGGTQSTAVAVNSRGQVVGGAFNTIPDPFEANFNSFLFFRGVTQEHAFLWENGVMHDVGTLGGPDSVAQNINERGQIAGWALTNSTPNAVTNFPTQDPFLWVPCDRDHWDNRDCENETESAAAKSGKMIDLGTLGGTQGSTSALNNRGQVVGQSNLAGDLTFHPFLWDDGELIDLGTLGGDSGDASWVNEAGEVVGWAHNKGNQALLAFLWKDGVMTNLGTVDGDPCSVAFMNNSKGQVVGQSGICGPVDHGFLWENGGPMIDLNTLVHPASDVTVIDAVFINDRGEISGLGIILFT
jgi:probable HAF family extracellular repeat protein